MLATVTSAGTVPELARQMNLARAQAMVDILSRSRSRALVTLAPTVGPRNPSLWREGRSMTLLPRGRPFRPDWDTSKEILYRVGRNSGLPFDLT